MTKNFLLATFFFVSFHPAKAQLEYALEPEKREILERDFERLCELDFDADFEFGSKEKWESVLKRAFGIEKIDCLEFKRFIEERVGLLVDHFQSDNLIAIDSFGTARRKEDWNFLFAHFAQRSVERIDLDIKESRSAAVRLEQFVYRVFHRMENELIWFLSNGMRMGNPVFILEYTTDGGGKKFSPAFSRASIPGVVFLTDDFFYNSYGGFDRMATLIHEARHESAEFDHVPCLNSESMSCDNAPNGPYGLNALFLAYIAGICGDDCSTMEKDFLSGRALWDFGRINLYQGDNHKIHPLLEGQLEDRSLVLDVYDLMLSLERQREE